MNPASIESYVARNNPSEVILALKEMGSPDPIDKQDLLYKIHVATEKFGEKAFKRLAEIDTPYKQMILAYAAQPEKEKKSNCCGANGEEKSNCSGCPSLEKKANADGEEKKDDKTMHYIAIASVVLLAVITIKTVVTK